MSAAAQRLSAAARLRDAAPDLLEAGAALLALVEGSRPGAEAVDMMRAAIAKATGAQS